MKTKPFLLSFHFSVSVPNHRSKRLRSLQLFDPAQNSGMAGAGA